MFNNYTLNRLLVLTATCGFAFLLADSVIEHFNLFKQEFIVYVPVAFSLIGLILGVITVYKWKPAYIKLMHLIFLFSILIALTGFYYHVEEESQEELVTLEKRLHEANEKEKPPLAPFAFGALAVVGLLGTYRKWKAEVIND